MEGDGHLQSYKAKYSGAGSTAEQRARCSVPWGLIPGRGRKDKPSLRDPTLVAGPARLPGTQCQVLAREAAGLESKGSKQRSCTISHAAPFPWAQLPFDPQVGTDEGHLLWELLALGAWGHKSCGSPALVQKIPGTDDPSVSSPELGPDS